MQFAAKVPEVLIIASLSTIVLDRIRHCLLGSGIQLGFPASSFQLSSILYHAKTEFWGALHFTRPFSKEDIFTTMLLLLSFILATLAGPSSAIAIVPKLAFYNSVRSGSEASNSKVFVKRSFDQLYPEYVNASILPDHCLEKNATLHRECPSAGLLTILGSRFVEAISLTADNVRIVELIDINFRAQDTFDGSENRNLRTLFFEGSDDIRANAAVSPPEYIPAVFVLHRKVAAYGDEVGMHGIGVKVTMGKPHLPKSNSTNASNLDGALFMPVASTSCIYSIFGAPSILLPRSAFDEIPWNSTATKDVTEIKSSTVLAGNLTSYRAYPNFTWIDADALRINSPLAGIFVVNSSDGKAKGHVFACTVEARWVGSQFETQPNPNDEADWIVKKWDVKGPQDNLQGGEYLRAQRPIRIHVNWAQSQNVRLENMMTGHTAVELLDSQCIERILRRSVSPDLDQSILQETTVCLETSLSLFIAYGLARMQASVPLEVTGGYSKSTYGAKRKSNLSASELQDSDLYTHLPVHVEYYGYGYNFHGPLIKLAFTTLLLHTLLALAHIVLVLRSGKSSNSWHHIGDLMALAINSKPSASLRDTGGGVGKGSTWALRLRVNVEQDDRVGLVIEDDVGMNEQVEKQITIASGKKYS